MTRVSAGTAPGRSETIQSSAAESLAAARAPIRPPSAGTADAPAADGPVADGLTADGPAADAATVEPSAAKASRSISMLERAARSVVLRRLGGMEAGELVMHERGGASHRLGRGGGLVTTVEVVDPAFWRRVMLSGSLGAAESWIRGEWTSPDVAAVLQLFVRDLVRLDGLDRGGRLGAWAARLWHRLRPNTRRGSRRNIHAHYDLGNDLFELFLDRTMTYSSGVHGPDDSLETAQIEKLDRICRKLELGPDDHVLEIGTGWGSFALHAAGRYGCQVTTTTISQEQHDLAAARFERAGLSDRIDLRMQDYRDLDGTFDAVVSIEMIEAVGHAFLPTYFQTIGRRLRPSGRACIQAITMPDHRYDAYRTQADFIQRYIFPGSCCPSVAAMSAAIGRGSDLRIADLEDIGIHYAETLRQWRDRFDARVAEVRDAGYDDRFVRLWRFYLAYCEAGFRERYIGNVQLVLERSGHGGSRASALDVERPGERRGADRDVGPGPNPDAALTR